MGPDYVIVTEADLDVAPDFFSYFAQLLPVLAGDPSLYCVSAWNDHVRGVLFRFVYARSSRVGRR